LHNRQCTLYSQLTRGISTARQKPTSEVMADVGEADDGDEIRDGDGRALDVKHAVAILANKELRGHFKAGTLTSAQYKQIACETAHQFAVSHVGVRLGNAFRHEVARCFHGKKALLLRPTSEGLTFVWSNTLKYAMRHLHSNNNSQAPLQLVFEVIEREQLLKERRAKDIVTAHFKDRMPFFPKLRGAHGALNLQRLQKERDHMQSCIAVRQKALQLNRVKVSDPPCPITLEAKAGRTLVNRAMRHEFERRLKQWWEIHKDDDPDDAADDAPDALHIQGPTWMWRASL